MESDLWKVCFSCEIKCCIQRKIAFPLFLTEEEKRSLPDINDVFPCKFYSQVGLCAIHEKRPIDCRLFPFDIALENGDFYWMRWNTECPISKAGYKKEWESYLDYLEAEIIPSFESYIKAYSQFRIDEFIKSFGGYSKIRKIKLA